MTSTMVLVLSNGDIISVSDSAGISAEAEFYGNSFDPELDPSQFSAAAATRLSAVEGAVSEPTIEIVGSISTGIAAAKWSPDEEILAIATNEKTFVFLSRYFDPLSESKISPDDHKLSKHVSVGWGKRETQFQGRGARAQRDPTMPEKVDIGTLSDSDNLEYVSISWRGDGEVVALNSIDHEPVTRRTVRVYTREGVLDSISEPVDYLVGQVSWRPSGNLIAAIQRHDAENRSPDVVFFERNGLRRGEFSLRTNPNEPVLGLGWNSDSDCLAVCLQNCVQLWTTKNYHWYLKQEIKAPGLSPVSLTWHPEKSHTLIITYEDSSIHFCELQWDITRGTTAPSTDLGLVVIVDGQNVNLSPLSIANVPPPMSFRTLKLQQTPTHVSIFKSNSRLAVLSGFELQIAEWNPTDPKNKGIRDIKAPEVKLTISLDDIIAGLDAPKQLTVVGDDIVIIASDNDDKTSDIVTLQLSTDENGQLSSYTVLASETISEQIYLIKSTPDAEQAIIQTVEGTVLSFRGKGTESYPITQLPRRCDAVEVYLPTEKDIFNGQAPVVFGLHSNGRIYANETQIASSATSICMTDKYLAFTTAQHYLKFCHLTQPDLISVPADTAVDDERCRAIERGSLIVTAMPSKSAFTLQAPRGNLETFYPRIMTLTLVRDHIRQKRYDLAFSTCRIHRIDLNILYDYNPTQFLESIELFVKQMKTTEYIDLFLSGLQDVDVSQTKYKETLEDINQQKEITKLYGGIERLGLGSGEQQASEYKPITIKSNAANKSEAPESKVNRICDAILAVLSGDSYKNDYRQSILTSYACKVPPALEDALKMVGKERESNPSLTQSSIQHLCFLQDVNLLYNTALGIYDLPLTLLIAQQSTKDPKEYLPFLRNLQSLEPLRRQFDIDTHLKRYSKALVHLAAIGDSAFEELKDYLVDHVLYKDALDIFKYDTAKQDKILSLQAHYLCTKSEYQQSGLIYEMLQDYINALESYMLGDCWRQALSIVERNSGGLFPPESGKLEKIAQQLAEKTYDAHKYDAAATIHYDYLNDPVEATRILCKGFLFDEALRIASKQKDDAGATYQKLIDTTIDPGLREGFAQITELLADCNSQIKSQVNRLNELRTKKAADPLAFFGGFAGEDGFNNADGAVIADNVSIAASETSTTPSFFTQYTGKTGGTAQTGASRRTAKNRRREERKKARGKKGSVYEEEYLISSMGRLAERLNDQQSEAARLVDGLLRRGMRTHAYRIQTAYVEIMETLGSCIVDIFTLSERDRERYDEEGNVYHLPQKEIPVIKPFPKTDVLDY